MDVHSCSLENCDGWHGWTRSSAAAAHTSTATAVVEDPAADGAHATAAARRSGRHVRRRRRRRQQPLWAASAPVASGAAVGASVKAGGDVRGPRRVRDDAGSPSPSPSSSGLVTLVYRWRWCVRYTKSRRRRDLSPWLRKTRVPTPLVPIRPKCLLGIALLNVQSNVTSH